MAALVGTSSTSPSLRAAPTTKFRRAEFSDFIRSAESSKKRESRRLSRAGARATSQWTRFLIKVPCRHSFYLKAAYRRHEKNACRASKQCKYVGPEVLRPCTATSPTSSTMPRLPPSTSSVPSMSTEKFSVLSA